MSLGPSCLTHVCTQLVSAIGACLSLTTVFATKPYTVRVELALRIKYEQTIMDIKKAVAKKTGVPVEKQQLFWHGKELTPAYDNKTLLEMNLHTGFSLNGYDLVSSRARGREVCVCVCARARARVCVCWGGGGGGYVGGGG